VSAKTVILGGPQAEAAAPVIRAAGVPVHVLGPRPAEELREIDAEGSRYTLVHVGAPEEVPGGSFDRAHHRVTLDQVAALAERLRPRERPLVTCLAFGYQHGVPEEATWLIDVRFLDNPYWVPSLRELTGRDPAVADYVLRQPAALELMGRLEAVLRWAIPLYQRDRLTVAFGCTGGRHRSVALAAEMARRLAEVDSFDVEFVTRDL
jgi:hypothetical protein